MWGRSGLVTIINSTRHMNTTQKSEQGTAADLVHNQETITPQAAQLCCAQYIPTLDQTRAPTFPWKNLTPQDLHTYFHKPQWLAYDGIYFHAME